MKICSQLHTLARWTRRIRHRTFESVADLEAAIHDYLARYNERCTPFVNTPWCRAPTTWC